MSIMISGISAFSKYLAEDFFFAKHMHDKNWGIRISSQPAWQNSGTTRVKNFLSRLTRYDYSFIFSLYS